MICLTEEQLVEIFYDEAEDLSLRKHLGSCRKCQEAFAAICSELIDLQIAVPDGGGRAVREALILCDNNRASTRSVSIMTVEEAAAWLRVDYQNICNMLHLLPHQVIDGKVRFDRQQLYQYLFGTVRANGMSASEKQNNCKNRFIHRITG
jgi:hypothetical protein